MAGPPIPAACRRIAKVCLRTCGVSFLVAMLGHLAAAAAAWTRSRWATGSVVIFRVVPRAVNTGALAGPGFSRCHSRSAAVVAESSSEIRSFQPLPCQVPLGLAAGRVPEPGKLGEEALPRSPQA
jgi:hypothetical protein